MITVLENVQAVRSASRILRTYQVDSVDKFCIPSTIQTQKSLLLLLLLDRLAHEGNTGVFYNFEFCFVFIFLCAVHYNISTKNLINIKWTNSLFLVKILSSNTSRLEAREGIFRLLMKGIFDPCVLWPFGKKFIHLQSIVATREHNKNLRFYVMSSDAKC